MPLIEDKNQQIDFARAIGQPDFSPDSQSFSELASAAFRTENSLGSLIVRNSGLPDDVVNNESFNPWDHITDDEKLNESFVKNITLADTIEEIDSVRKQSAREQKDRQALSEGGANSFFAQMAVGAIDPNAAGQFQGLFGAGGLYTDDNDPDDDEESGFFAKIINFFKNLMP